MLTIDQRQDSVNKPNRMKWHAVHVMSRHEKSVAYVLNAKGFEELSPLYSSRRKWGKRYEVIHLPLFPGYVFCRFDPEHRVPILNTPGVIDIVRFGNVLAEIDPAEIAAVRRVMSSSFACEPWPHLEIGERVELEHGPLAGLEGTVVEILKLPRLVVSVTLLRRSVAIEIDREWIRSSAPQRKEQVASLGKLA